MTPQLDGARNSRSSQFTMEVLEIIVLKYGRPANKQQCIAMLPAAMGISGRLFAARHQDLRHALFLPVL